MTPRKAFCVLVLLALIAIAFINKELFLAVLVTIGAYLIIMYLIFALGTNCWNPWNNMENQD